MGQFGVSQPVLRREDDRLLTGRGRFADDLAPAGTAHGHMLRSPHANARIARLDVAAARQAPGVLAVYTAAELEAAGIGAISCLSVPKLKPGTRFNEHLQPVLADSHVRHVGDGVAFVVAETAEQARDAAELIEADYEELPAVIGCDRAAAPDAPRLREGTEDNTCFHFEMGDGAAVQAAFDGAAHVTMLDLINNRVVLNAIEGRGCLAEYDPAALDGRGKFELTVTTQMPNGMRDQLADAVLKVERERLRVRVHDVGGGFGGKNSSYPEYVLCLLAARELGRPVKWIGSRSEAFVSDFHGRDNVTRGALAFDAEGRIQAIRVRTHADLGAYVASRGTVSPVNGLVMLSNCYRIPAMHAEVIAVYTNTVPTDPYRGAGRPEVTYMIERLMDLAADELGLDRVELRRRNLIPPDAFPYRTPTGLSYDDCDFAAVMEAALARAGWAGIEARRAEAKARGRLRGIGLCNYVERCGGGGGLSEAARLEFDAEGNVTVYSGSMSNGQGHETAFSQIVAEHLGLPFEAIRIVEGDTDLIASGSGTGGSWSIPMGGGAISLAAEQVIAKGRRIAAHLLEAAEADMEFADGTFRIAGTDRAVSLQAVAAAARDPAALPEGEEPGLDQEARFTPDNYTYPYGCHVAEVEIDPETGAVELVG
ncbi:MAG TPA: xanthine dehydrogenase family protein molybdopterin-binding subunit, partial [Alphaproteobacteria bacterium]|nr:xanthine dehydrogenase family protein molybdopterin-binding subunit [Alphaproteobacteria bacterium]